MDFLTLNVRGMSAGCSVKLEITRQQQHHNIPLSTLLVNIRTVTRRNYNCDKVDIIGQLKEIHSRGVGG